MILVSHRTLWVRLALLAGVAALVCFPARRIRASHASEYEVKAAYLYNFGRFVEWPTDVPSSHVDEFPICVLGEDPFGPALDLTISGEKIGGKSVVARRISEIETASTCRVLFVSSSEDKRIKEILAAAGKLSILTVSDLPRFVEKGGMVQFILANRTVRFTINLDAAQQARLNLSSQLLKVAVEVKGNPRPGA